MLRYSAFICCSVTLCFLQYLLVVSLHLWYGTGSSPITKASNAHRCGVWIVDRYWKIFSLYRFNSLMAVTVGDLVFRHWKLAVWYWQAWFGDQYMCIEPWRPKSSRALASIFRLLDAKTAVLSLVQHVCNWPNSLFGAEAYKISDNNRLPLSVGVKVNMCQSSNVEMLHASFLDIDSYFWGKLGCMQSILYNDVDKYVGLESGLWIRNQ